MLEIENQQMKIIKEQRETELLRQIRHLQDDKEELQKQLDGKRFDFFCEIQKLKFLVC
jgi:hypothetical protein